MSDSDETYCSQSKICSQLLSKFFDDNNSLNVESILKRIEGNLSKQLEENTLEEYLNEIKGLTIINPMQKQLANTLKMKLEEYLCQIHDFKSHILDETSLSKDIEMLECPKNRYNLRYNRTSSSTELLNMLSNQDFQYPSQGRTVQRKSNEVFKKPSKIKRRGRPYKYSNRSRKINPSRSFGSILEEVGGSCIQVDHKFDIEKQNSNASIKSHEENSDIKVENNSSIEETQSQMDTTTDTVLSEFTGEFICLSGKSEENSRRDAIQGTEVVDDTILESQELNEFPLTIFEVTAETENDIIPETQYSITKFEQESPSSGFKNKKEKISENLDRCCEQIIMLEQFLAEGLKKITRDKSEKEMLDNQSVSYQCQKRFDPILDDLQKNIKEELKKKSDLDENYDDSFDMSDLLPFFN